MADEKKPDVITVDLPNQGLQTLLANNPQMLDRVIIKGDLSRLSDSEKNQYYFTLCGSLGLNPLTRPFEYVVLNNKLTLYAKKDCADQLRKKYHLSIQVVGREMVGGSYRVIARATFPDGRTEENVGAHWIEGMMGENHANAIMKAETKALRRVTLSACGLGFLDEEEVDSVRGAIKVVDKTSRINAEEIKALEKDIAERKADMSKIKETFQITQLAELTVNNARKLKDLLTTM